MYISVLLGDIHRSPWIAVQWNENLQDLLDDQSYRSNVSTTFRKAGERPLQTKQLYDELGNGPVTANVYQVASRDLFSVEATVARGRTGAAKKAAPKKAAPKKAAKKTVAKKATKKATPKKASPKKAIKKAAPKKSTPKKAGKKTSKKAAKKGKKKGNQ